MGWPSTGFDACARAEYRPAHRALLSTSASLGARCGASCWLLAPQPALRWSQAPPPPSIPPAAAQPTLLTPRRLHPPARRPPAPTPPRLASTATQMATAPPRPGISPSRMATLRRRPGPRRRQRRRGDGDGHRHRHPAMLAGHGHRRSRPRHRPSAPATGIQSKFLSRCNSDRLQHPRQRRQRAPPPAPGLPGARRSVDQGSSDGDGSNATGVSTLPLHGPFSTASCSASISVGGSDGAVPMCNASATNTIAIGGGSGAAGAAGEQHEIVIAIGGGDVTMAPPRRPWPRWRSERPRFLFRRSRRGETIRSIASE